MDRSQCGPGSTDRPGRPADGRGDDEHHAGPERPELGGPGGGRAEDLGRGPGVGAPLAAGGSVTVFYTGWLAANGTKFDSRRSPAAPATFALSGLIQGWQQGLLGMKPGGIRRLFVPAALGYGAAGSPPSIPANADLVFEIKLISHT